ncbi:aminodeoxychorismate lyase [Galactobacter sp.]|uniref:aminodeoxychorismate lyase n=1 Tax=Galactobacter sp. TaxID=2676125 RepID=UPI0025C555D2|nr:aminodeoxychorismate lyase [Galactobacter sp.]
MPTTPETVVLSAVMLTEAHPRGVLVDVEQPQLLLSDRAASRGDGVFESLLLRRGALRSLEEHLARLRRSAEALRLRGPDDAAWKAAIGTCLDAAVGQWDAPTAPEVSVKLVLSRGPEGRGQGPTAWVLVAPVPHRTRYGPERGLKVITLDRGYPAGIGQRAPWLLIGVKTLSYAVNLAAQRWAVEHGADDAIFVSTDGVVLEGATSSVILANVGQDGVVTLTTPADEDGLLPGTTQAAAFRVATSLGWRVEARRVRVDDLERADALWLVSSVRLAAAVTELDGVKIPCDPKLHRQLWEGLDREL